MVGLVPKWVTDVTANFGGGRGEVRNVVEDIFPRDGGKMKGGTAPRPFQFWRVQAPLRRGLRTEVCEV